MRKLRIQFEQVAARAQTAIAHEQSQEIEMQRQCEPHFETHIAGKMNEMMTQAQMASTEISSARDFIAQLENEAQQQSKAI